LATPQSVGSHVNPSGSEGVPENAVFYPDQNIERDSNSIDEIPNKKPTPIELELKYIEKTLVSQSRKEHSMSLIFLAHFSTLTFKYSLKCGEFDVKNIRYNKYNKRIQPPS
jgi:hypothetical protein